MGRPFIVHVNLSHVLTDCTETRYTMSIDDTQMTIVHEFVEWIQWLFSLRQCIYLTHGGSVIHELEDIKIFSVLNNVEVRHCNVFPCIHMKLHNLFRKLNFFVEWGDIKVPKLFLYRVNVMAEKLGQNNCTPFNKEEETVDMEVEEAENSNAKRLCLDSVNNCENQLSENLKIPSDNNSKTNFIDNLSMNLDNRTVSVENSSNTNVVESDKCKNLVDSIKISKAEIEEIKALKDINLSGKPKSKREVEEVDSSNNEIVSSSLKRSQLKSDDSQQGFVSKMMKSCSRPFSLGGILTNLRTEPNTSTGCVLKGLSSQENQNCLPSQALNIDESMDVDLLNSRKKRKRIRKHRSRRQEGGSGVDSPSFSSNNEESTPKSVEQYTAFCEKKSNHIRFHSDNEDFETEYTKSEEQPKGTEVNEVSKTENGMQGSLSMSHLNISNKCDENKPDDSSGTNKEFSTLDKLLILQEKRSETKKFLEYLMENNRASNSVRETVPDCYYNISTIKALKQKFPSPVVVERFY